MVRTNWGRRILQTTKLVCVLMCGFAGTGFGRAEAMKTDLLQIVQSICIDTGGAPEAVERAILGAGGKRISIRPAATSMGGKFVGAWKIELGLRSARISSWTGRIDSFDGKREMDAVLCNIEIDTADEAEVAAVREWSGFDVSLPWHNFQMDGRGPMPLSTSYSENRIAEREGRVWRIEIEQSGTKIVVSLMHRFGIR